jgi:hypothetical protein
MAEHTDEERHLFSAGLRLLVLAQQHLHVQSAWLTMPRCMLHCYPASDCKDHPTLLQQFNWSSLL